MAQYRVQFFVCDRCLVNGEDVNAVETFTIAFHGKRPRLLDLCEDHAQPLREIEEFSISAGRRGRDVAARRGEV